MADLDDFFAKKDRKKSKTTKKFATTTEELVKKIEDTSARTKIDVRPAAARVTSAVPGTIAEGAEELGEVIETAPVVVEDEWREFEVEERKDYSGLKIGQLQIVDDEEANADDGAYDKYDSDGELNTDPDRKQSGPWNKTDEAAGKASGASSVPAPAAVAAAPSANSAYVSPGMRNYTPLKARTRKGILPDIHDQDYFPVLGSAKPEEVKKKRPEPGYEEVRHGGRAQRPSDIATNAPVSIGNRFNSLADS